MLTHRGEVFGEMLLDAFVFGVCFFHELRSLEFGEHSGGDVSFEIGQFFGSELRWWSRDEKLNESGEGEG